MNPNSTSLDLIELKFQISSLHLSTGQLIHLFNKYLLGAY